VAGAAERTKYLYRKTVKGRSYIYFRQPGGKLIPLPPDEGSSEFNRSYDACIKALTNKPDAGAVAAAKPARTERVAFIGGTIGAAITRYRQSAAYAALKANSKRVYDVALSTVQDLIGDTKLADLDLDAVDIYSEQVAREHGTSMADLHVIMISNIWRVCRKFPEFGIRGRPSPTFDAERHHKVKSPARPWDEAAQAKFMATAPDTLKLAKLLLHFSGQRGGDAVKMRWSDFDGEGIFVRPEKTADGGDHEADYCLCPRPLLDALVARQAKGNLGETILTNRHGKPWKSSHSLSCVIRNHLIKIGLAKRGTKTISMHGLRKNAASDVSALLVGTAGIKSVTKHRSNAMADYYAKHADQIAMGRQVVGKWNEALAVKAEKRVAKRRATLRVAK
jgi:integrase